MKKVLCVIGIASFVGAVATIYLLKACRHSSKHSDREIDFPQNDKLCHKTGIEYSSEKVSNKTEHDMCNEHKKAEQEQPETTYTLSSEYAPNQDVQFIDDDPPKNAFERMDTRHIEAANIIKGSIENIHQNVKFSEDINNKLDKVSAELDKMLSEVQ